MKKLCIPVVGPTCVEAARQAAEGSLKGDLLELRLDLWESYDLSSLAALRSTLPLPVIFTLRRRDQGGSYSGSEIERLAALEQLAALSPTYLDVEYDVPAAFVEQIRRAHPEVQVILSYHDFTQTPQDLAAVLKQMQRIPATLYKIACKANSTQDSLRMLAFTRQHAPLLGICMGELGGITRVLGPLMGSPWTFTSLSAAQQSAEGQLTVDAFRTLYHSSVTRSSGMYGLIGGTVSQSLSHLTHNRTMQELALEAVYVKMVVQPDELGEFFSLAKQVGIRGLSVTIPLKEHVIPFLDYIDPEAKKIGAVNTILFRQGQLHGYNTDGKGALDAIESRVKVKNKRMAILGAGGAARAIIYEAKRRGATVSLFNRTTEKGVRLAQEFEVEGGGLSLIEEYPYDILINTTPAPLPLPPSAIRPRTVVMDIKTLPKMSPFLSEAAARNCELVFGYEMFINQAASQFALWFECDRNRVLSILHHAIHAI